MALRFMQLQEIAALLRDVPALINRLEHHEAGFHEGVLSWLRRVEQVLEANRLPVVSEVAAYRGLLLQASRGQLIPEINITGRVTRRKLRDAAASHVVYRCNALLQETIRAALGTFEEAERICRQLVAVARAKGHVDACRMEGEHAKALACVKNLIANDSDLAAAHVHLAGLVGKQDADILLDRAIPELG